MSSVRFFEKLSEMFGRLDTSRLSDLYSFRQELIDQSKFLHTSYINGDFDGLIDINDNLVPRPIPETPTWNPDLIKIELFRNLIQAVSQTMDIIINTVHRSEQEREKAHKRFKTNIEEHFVEEHFVYPISAVHITEREAHSLRFNPVPQYPPRTIPS